MLPAGRLSGVDLPALEADAQQPVTRRPGAGGRAGDHAEGRPVGGRVISVPEIIDHFLDAHRIPGREHAVRDVPAHVAVRSGVHIHAKGGQGIAGDLQERIVVDARVGFGVEFAGLERQGHGRGFGRDIPGAGGAMAVPPGHPVVRELGNGAVRKSEADDHEAEEQGEAFRHDGSPGKCDESRTHQPGRPGLRYAGRSVGRLGPFHQRLESRGPQEAGDHRHQHDGVFEGHGYQALFHADGGGGHDEAQPGGEQQPHFQGRSRGQPLKGEKQARQELDRQGQPQQPQAHHQLAGAENIGAGQSPGPRG